MQLVLFKDKKFPHVFSKYLLIKDVRRYEIQFPVYEYFIRLKVADTVVCPFFYSFWQFCHLPTLSSSALFILSLDARNTTTLLTLLKIKFRMLILCLSFGFATSIIKNLCFVPFLLCYEDFCFLPPTGYLHTPAHRHWSQRYRRRQIKIISSRTFCYICTLNVISGSLGSLPELGDLYEKPGIPKLRWLFLYMVGSRTFIEGTDEHKKNDGTFR